MRYYNESVQVNEFIACKEMECGKERKKKGEITRFSFDL